MMMWTLVILVMWLSCSWIWSRDGFFGGSFERRRDVLKADGGPWKYARSLPAYTSAEKVVKHGLYMRGLRVELMLGLVLGCRGRSWVWVRLNVKCSFAWMLLVLSCWYPYLHHESSHIHASANASRRVWRTNVYNHFTLPYEDTFYRRSTCLQLNWAYRKWLNNTTKLLVGVQFSCARPGKWKKKSTTTTTCYRCHHLLSLFLSFSGRIKETLQ